MYFSSRDGRVPVECSIVNQITDVFRWWREGQLSVERWHVPVKVLNLYCQDKTLLTRSEGLSLTDSNICANGSAIKGGCVTRREHRADPGSLAAKQSRCQEGMARVFAVQVGTS
jgi:hypothetical protein